MTAGDTNTSSQPKRSVDKTSLKEKLRKYKCRHKFPHLHAEIEGMALVVSIVEFDFLVYEKDVKKKRSIHKKVSTSLMYKWPNGADQRMLSNLHSTIEWAQPVNSFAKRLSPYNGDKNNPVTREEFLKMSMRVTQLEKEIGNMKMFLNAQQSWDYVKLRKEISTKSRIDSSNTVKTNRWALQNFYDVKSSQVINTPFAIDKSMRCLKELDVSGKSGSDLQCKDSDNVLEIMKIRQDIKRQKAELKERLSSLKSEQIKNDSTVTRLALDTSKERKKPDKKDKKDDKKRGKKISKKENSQSKGKSRDCDKNRSKDGSNKKSKGRSSDSCVKQKSKTKMKIKGKNKDSSRTVLDSGFKKKIWEKKSILGWREFLDYLSSSLHDKDRLNRDTKIQEDNQKEQNKEGKDSERSSSRRRRDSKKKEPDKKVGKNKGDNKYKK